MGTQSGCPPCAPVSPGSSRCGQGRVAWGPLCPGESGGCGQQA